MGSTGFDPMKGKYVGTWIDSMSPTMMVLEGDFDASRQGADDDRHGASAWTASRPKHRMVTTHVDAKTDALRDVRHRQTTARR
jgi:hypothetical protein